MEKRGWDKSPSLSIVFGLSSKTQWLSGLYYADFISFYSPTQLCGGGTTKSNSNELPISVPLSAFCVSMLLIVRVLQSQPECWLGRWRRGVWLRQKSHEGSEGRGHGIHERQCAHL